ncbi:MAG: YdeI/OmpD-associated family protein [Steroidobacteraceae bacterium]
MLAYPVCAEVSNLGSPQMPPPSTRPAPKFFATAREFRKWLSKHAAVEKEILVGFNKVHSGKPSMTWSESVDEAICFGWIDGVRKRIDEHTYQIRFTPRKPDSIWSAVNIAKFESLSSKRKITSAGAAAFARRTDAKSVVYSYEQEQLAELSASEVYAFRQTGNAWEFLQRTPPSYRRVVLHWVVRAKKAETRASRFQKLLQACIAGQRLR